MSGLAVLAGSSGLAFAGGAVDGAREAAGALGDRIAVEAGEFPSPLIQVEAHPGLHGLSMRLDAGLVELMSNEPRLIVRGFMLEGGEVDLELEPFRIFSPNARRVVLDEAGEEHVTIGGDPEVHLFRGSVVGAEGSTVFLAMGPHGANGFLDFGDQVHVVASGPYASGLPHAVYNLTALPEGAILWRQFVCGLDGLAAQGEAAADEALVGDGGDVELFLDSTCRVINIALDSDWTFTRDLFGSNPAAAEAYMATLMGAVNEIYERDVSTGFSLVFTRTFASNNSPYNSNSIYTALNTIASVFQNELAHIDRQLAHLLSARRYNEAGGVAYLNAVCRTDIGYGVNGHLNGTFPYPLLNNNAQNWDIVVVAHEIGHNVGTGHTHDSFEPPIDNCGNGSCAGASNGTIMSYCHVCPGGISNTRLEFHPLVRNRIAGYLTGIAIGGQCGSSFEVVPPTVIQHPDDQSVPIGFDAHFSVVVDEGAGPVSYRWRRNSATIPGATAPSLTIYGVQPSDGGVYDCLIISQCGQTVTIPALLEVTGSDCTGSGLDDAYEISIGIEEDCNNNGRPDVCDLAEIDVHVQSPRYEPLDRNQTFSLNLGFTTHAITDVVIQTRARGRLGGSTERVGVRINGQFMGWLYEFAGSNCNGSFDVDTIVIPKALFNSAFTPGELSIDFTPTFNVIPNACLKATFFEATVSFSQGALSVDSTGDGKPDECADVAPCSSADISGPLGYGSPDGVVDAFDLNDYIALWMSNDPAADRTGPTGDGTPDGVVDAFDLSDYITAWLAGCD